MARSLSWIDATELTSLFKDGEADDSREVELAGLMEDLPGFDLRRRTASSQLSRSASQPTASPRPHAGERPLARASEAGALPGSGPEGSLSPVMEALAEDTTALQKPRRAAPAPSSASASVTPPGSAGRNTPTQAPQAPSEEPTHVYRTPKLGAPAQGIPALAATAPAMAAFMPSKDGDVFGRMREYIDWLTGQAPIEGIAIADAQGLVVAEHNVAEADAVIATSIDMFLEHANAVLEREAQKQDPALFGYVALKHGDRHVAAVWAPSVYGRFYGIFIGRVTPTPDMLTLAGQGFRAIFAE